MFTTIFSKMHFNFQYFCKKQKTKKHTVNTRYGTTKPDKHHTVKIETHQFATAGYSIQIPNYCYKFPSSESLQSS